MIAIPTDQTTTGYGNDVLPELPALGLKSLHIVYMNSDGTIYSAGGSATFRIVASNEPIDVPANLIAPIDMTAVITLNAASPAYLYDINGNYRNIAIVIDSIAANSKLTAHPHAAY